MTQVTHMTKIPAHSGRDETLHERVRATMGPVRTLKVGDRITVYGDLDVIAVVGRRVQVRVVRASAPPPEPVMFPVTR
jgi:hypothetical protein